MTPHEETRELLIRAQHMGLKRREVAAILGVSVQRVSDYYRLLRTGTGDAVPTNGRKVLRLALDERDKVARPPVYPSEKGAYVHNLIEMLGNKTGFKGTLWDMVQRLIEDAIRHQ